MSRFIDPPQSADEKLAELIADEEARLDDWQRKDLEREREAREWKA